MILSPLIQHSSTSPWPLGSANVALPEGNTIVTLPSPPELEYLPSIFPAQLVIPGFGGTPPCAAGGAAAAPAYRMFSGPAQVSRFPASLIWYSCPIVVTISPVSQ